MTEGITMGASNRLNVRKLAKRKVVQYIIICIMNTFCAGMLWSQTLHGFVLTGNPASSSGATWTYRDTVQGIIYDLAGILLKPAGTSNLPAVVISHGHDGNVSIYSIDIAKVMRSWGLVCIATNYTHAGGVPIGSPGDSTQQGASTPNILRARKCVDILASLGYVDTTRIAAHGNSMGAFVNAAFVGTYPKLFRVASHSAGGMNDLWVSATKTAQANGIITPYQIHHGDADTTVPLPNDQRLDSLLHARGVEQQMYIYPGYSHTDITFDSTMLGRVRTWYAAHGLIPATAVNEDDTRLPRSFSLAQNYPNPFNPSTTIGYRQLASGNSWVRLSVYDMLGREVEVLVDEKKAPGDYEVKFDGSGLSSGVYFYRLQAGSFVETKKLLMLR